ncbi:MAG TPA: TIGR03435 family protein [Bryobacteraceae bacterium]|nr:TIGR03435 family protein [Bryobacteraceae bacterium]
MRFELRVHIETRELPMYRLVIAKNGPKIERRAETAGSTPAGIRSSCGRMTGTNTTIANLAVYLSRQLHRPVEDQCGLTGKYNFEFEWTPDDTPCSPATEGLRCLQHCRKSSDFGWKAEKVRNRSSSSIT